MRPLESLARPVRAVALLGLALTGCAPTHLVFHQNTVLGVDVATSVEGGTVHATVAYDRQTTAFVPKTKVQIPETRPDGNTVIREEYEAMSVISKSAIDIRFLRNHEIHEVFATGDAAVNIARDADAVKALGQVAQ